VPPCLNQSGLHFIYNAWHNHISYLKRKRPAKYRSIMWM
jgi:hypothetical protein